MLKQKVTFKNGTIFHYADKEHLGYSYDTCDNASGIYRAIDTSDYPRKITAELIRGNSDFFRIDFYNIDWQLGDTIIILSE